MAAGSTTFPTTLDSNAVADNTTEISSGGFNDHSIQIEAIETKIGVNNSAVTTSLDYFLKHASGAFRTHKHDGTSDDGAKLNWDDIWTDAVHSHASNAEGGVIGATGIDINIGASVYLTADQLNITDVTWTKILFNSESFDLGNNFASNKFTVPTGGDGIYDITLMVNFINLVANKRYYAAIYKNNALYQLAVSCNGSDTTSVTTTVPVVIQLAAGDYIEGYVYVNTGVNTVDIDGTSGYTRMNIMFRSL